MVTIHRLQRLWDERAYGRLSTEVLGIRPEAAILSRVEGSTALAAAASTIVRLDELSQSGSRLCSVLLRTLLAAQQADGGWGDLLTTTLCVRALCAGKGHGVAIERGMAYLANLQKPEGIWPAEPLRRMPEDAFTSAYILLQLGGDYRFQEAVDVHAAVTWFEQNWSTLDRTTKQLWENAKRRVGRVSRSEVTLWS